jgi:hypothetical protein
MEEVCGPSILSLSLISLPDQVNLEPSMEVSDNSVSHLPATEHHASEASTVSTTNSCFPIIWVMFFTILVELRQVAQRNLEFCKNSFYASVKKSNCIIDCMPYGLEFECPQLQKLMIIFEVLHPDG